MKKAIIICSLVLSVLLISPLQGYKILSKEFEEHSTALDYLRTVNRTIDDVLNGKFSLKCSACEVFVEVLQVLVRTNASEEDIVYVITQGCILLHIEDKRVCSYIIEEYRDEFISVAARLLLHPPWLCYAAIGPECGQPIDIFPFWNVTIPPNKPKPVDPVKPPEDFPKLKVVQLSDVHIDLVYKPGSNTDCGEPLCCREGSGKTPNTTAGFWGSTFGQCDIPLYTYKNALQFIAEEIKPDIIIWTGDIPAHNVWKQKRQQQLEHIDIAVSEIVKHFPHVRVYPSLGNHESAPADSFPPPGLTSEKLSNDWLNTYLQSAWSKWLPPESLDTVGYAGYYSVQHNSKLRVISLNTQYCDQLNFWLYLNNTDPGGMLQWLVQELSWAEAYGVKVIILGHIPTGASDCFKAFSWNYYKIVDRFESTIVGQFVGHTHKDEIRMFFSDDDGHPTGFQFISPSLTTYSYINPSFRVYTLDGPYPEATYQTLDHVTYLLDLERANKKNETVWEVEYTASKAYNMTWITAKEMYKLYHRLNTDKEFFCSTYGRFYEHSRSGVSCDDDWFKNLMCQFITGRSHDPSICKDLPLHQQLAFAQENKLC